MAFSARSRSSTSSVKVKVFRSLLLLSLLEGVLWSLCLFHSSSASGLAYYQRETVRQRRAGGTGTGKALGPCGLALTAADGAQVNLKSTTASRLRSPPLLPALDPRALLLALRVRRSLKSTGTGGG